MHLLNDKTKNTMRIRLYRLCTGYVQVKYPDSMFVEKEFRVQESRLSKLLLSLSASCQIFKSNVVRVLKSMTAQSESEVVPRPGHDGHNTNDG
jgi:hypothetical protein